MLPQEIIDLDAEIIMVQIFHQCFKYIVINLYLPSVNRFGYRKRKTLKRWIIEFIAINNHEKFIICGDFNDKESLLEELYLLNSLNIPTFNRQSSTPSTIDFVYTSFKCDYEIEYLTYEGISDHILV
jgi:hypothetical protein